MNPNEFDSFFEPAPYPSMEYLNKNSLKPLPKFGSFQGLNSQQAGESINEMLARERERQFQEEVRRMNEEAKLREQEEHRRMMDYLNHMALMKQAQEVEQTDDEDLIDPPDFQPMDIGKEPT